MSPLLWEPQAPPLQHHRPTLWPGDPVDFSTLGGKPSPQFLGKGEELFELGSPEHPSQSSESVYPPSNVGLRGGNRGTATAQTLSVKGQLMKLLSHVQA